MIIRALTDQSFREELDRNLAACGLVLLDNPYAAYVGVGLLPPATDGVFRADDRWLSNTLGLSKSEITLLVVLWALLIVPKRERQLERLDTSGQQTLIKSAKIDRTPRERVALRTLLEDFRHLWAPTYVRRCLGVLARHRLIAIDDGYVIEGPRLDLIMD